jgi:hypothetical protein
MSELALFATKRSYKAMLHTNIHVIDTDNHGLILLPKINNEGFYLEEISDVECGGDPDTRISVFGCNL